MFIKNVQENRLREKKNEDDIINNVFKLKMHKMGSIKNGKVNYDRDEQFFSMEDVPLENLEKKEEILQFVDPDNLELRKKEWNTSVLVPLNPLSE